MATVTVRMSPPRRFRFRDLLWPILVAAVVIAASHRSTVAAPHVVNIDKVAHFSVYGLLATLVCRLGHGWRGALWGLIAASLFGISDELHQRFVPGRDSSVADWAADTLGALIAVALYWGWTWYRRALETPVARLVPGREVAPTPEPVRSDESGS